MEEKRKKSGGCSVVTIIGIGLVLLPVLYVLSVGPVTTLLNHNLIPMWLAEMLFAPLERIGLRLPAFHKILVWYCELWNW